MLGRHTKSIPNFHWYRFMLVIYLLPIISYECIYSKTAQNLGLAICQPWYVNKQYLPVLAMHPEMTCDHIALNAEVMPRRPSVATQVNPYLLWWRPLLVLLGVNRKLKVMEVIYPRAYVPYGLEASHIHTSDVSRSIYHCSHNLWEVIDEDYTVLFDVFANHSRLPITTGGCTYVVASLTVSSQYLLNNVVFDLPNASALPLYVLVGTQYEGYTYLLQHLLIFPVITPFRGTYNLLTHGVCVQGGSGPSQVWILCTYHDAHLCYYPSRCTEGYCSVFCCPSVLDCFCDYFASSMYTVYVIKLTPPIPYGCISGRVGSVHVVHLNQTWCFTPDGFRCSVCPNLHSPLYFYPMEDGLATYLMNSSCVPSLCHTSTYKPPYAVYLGPHWFLFYEGLPCLRYCLSCIILTCRPCIGIFDPSDKLQDAIRP